MFAVGLGVVDTYLQSKAYISGDRVEVYKYANPIRCGYSRGYQIERREEPGKKRSGNLLRAQRTVRQLVWANLSRYTKFLTLTYSETVLDYEVFKVNFKAFKVAMRRKGYNLRYLYVLEHQKSRGENEGNDGCLHCHLVIFNDEYIPYQDIRHCWPYGNIDIHVLKGTRYENNHRSAEKINDLAAYVSKYITKETVALPGDRCYSCSTGLKRPIEKRDELYQWTTSNGFTDGVYNPETSSFFDELYFMFIPKFSCSSSWSYLIRDGTMKNNTLTYTQGVLKR